MKCLYQRLKRHTFWHVKRFLYLSVGALSNVESMAPYILHLIVTFSFEHKTYINDFVEHCVALVD